MPASSNRLLEKRAPAVIVWVMDTTILVTFVLVYGGMILGRIPGLAVNRTGIALLGAIVLLVSGRVSPVEAWGSVDVPTIGLLFGLMVVSAQFRLGGVYSAVTRRMAEAQVSPQGLLALVIATSGILSALLANDIVCLAVAPLLIEGCARRGLNPVPFLLALACASNIGSAATLIGNPQNMLIGQTLNMSFAGYLLDGGIPAALGLVTLWWLLCRLCRGEWLVRVSVGAVDAPPLDHWNAVKGMVILWSLVLAFLFVGAPREVLALSAAGLTLTSRRMHSRNTLALVDWQLLLLFISLFIVNHALRSGGAMERVLQAFGEKGADVRDPLWLFPITVVLSNLVSNVPAVMLLLPAATHPLAGPVLALSSTLAGNLVIVGSIANIIVVEQAAALGINIGWKQHARVGIPVTLSTLAIAGAWLAFRAAV